METEKMRLTKSLTVVLTFFLFLTFTVGETFSQTKKKTTKKKTTTTKTTTTKTTTSTTPTLTDNEITGGLKEALSNGVKFAVDYLGKENGFLNDVRVKIPVPKSLQNVEKALRFARQDKLVDDFVKSMNNAAEKAVPVAVDVFVDAIKQMTFDDARKILFSKEDDSATQFFRRTGEETLRGKFRPIVEKFTEETGVTAQYKKMLGKAGIAAKFLGNEAQDLDGYVTQKALDGLFFIVAEEEKKIRKDPLGRTTDLLKKVFGSIFK
jgi:hypothetical protein